MEELTERQKVLKQLGRTIEEWTTAQSIAAECCPNCNGQIDAELEDGVCEECGEEYGDAVAEYGQDGPQPLTIDRHVISRIWVTFGGPNAYVDYNHRTGTGKFFSTYYGDGETVELTREECGDVAQLFALDSVGADLDSDTREELGLS